MTHLQQQPSPPRRICIGTRESVLALAQTDIVHRYLATNFPDIEITIHALKTSGDKNLTQPLHEMARKALWTEELEDLLLERRVDIIVHSLKDMPTQLPTTCCIGAILEREDPRDALVVRADLPYPSLSSLPHGAVVGTSSVRRMAQISRLYPHLKLKDMRGNVPRRIAKLDNATLGYDALILAAAGLLRLGLGGRITEYLEAPEVLHAVGQGAIAVEVRDGDEEMLKLVEGLVHAPTERACLAERALLRTLEGGCSVPIGVQTHWEGAVLVMKAVVASVDGTQVVETEERSEVGDAAQAEVFGRFVAGKLVELGATPILIEIERRKVEKAAEDEEKRRAEVAAEEEEVEGVVVV
ncbi:porphobilinogen deaminase, dipyromethane cofactor binding domain-containing protein [Trichophaea hybrida]|nr:porphobilinogen deaminase, dipyromethane cofactor binding domain-containing protein [Trichophaea hybrida]